MNDSLINYSCKDFAEKLASKESVPGGGGAAALVGALAVALGSMAANFTLGKKSYANVQEDIKEMLSRGEFLRKWLLELVDADAKAFLPLSKAYSMPQSDEKDTLIQKYTLEALNPPMEMLSACQEITGLLEDLENKCSKMLISDVACAANLCVASIKSAATNVYINTKTLTDIDKKAELEGIADSVVERCVSKCEAVSARINAKIRGLGNA